MLTDELTQLAQESWLIVATAAVYIPRKCAFCMHIILVSIQRGNGVGSQIIKMHADRWML